MDTFYLLCLAFGGFVCLAWGVTHWRERQHELASAWGVAALVVGALAHIVVR